MVSSFSSFRAGAAPVGLLLVALLGTSFLTVETLGKSKLPGIRVTGDAKKGVLPTLSFGANDIVAMTATPEGLLIREVDPKKANLTLSAAKVLAGTMKVTGSLSATQLTANGVSQWKLVDLDTFDVDTADSNRWSSNAHSFCGNSGDFFLGGHCKFASEKTARTYEQLPPHTRVKVTARVHYFDEWHGESVSMALDDQPTWAQSHNWCPQFLKWMCKKYGVDSCGRDMPDRLSAQVSSTIHHTAPSLNVSFSSTLGKDADSCYVSWGVDDVAVYVA